jgi:hypothetical protein
MYFYFLNIVYLIPNSLKWFMQDFILHSGVATIQLACQKICSVGVFHLYQLEVVSQGVGKANPGG